MPLIGTEFLIDERDGKSPARGDKKINVADISTATDVRPNAAVPGATYRADAGGLQVDGKPIETAVGVTTDAAAVDQLKKLGITVASKTLKLNLGRLLTDFKCQGRVLRARQDRGPGHSRRRQDPGDRQRQRLRDGGHRVVDTTV